MKMEITYKCPCDEKLIFLVEDILKQIDVKIKEVCVVVADDRRIHLRVKVWNEDGEPSVMGMLKGSWENSHWVLKYEFNTLNEFKETMSYILYDTKPSKIEENTSKNTFLIKDLMPESVMEGIGCSLADIDREYLITPTLIERGYYMLEKTDKGICVTPVRFIDD